MAKIDLINFIYASNTPILVLSEKEGKMKQELINRIMAKRMANGCQPKCCLVVGG